MFAMCIKISEVALHFGNATKSWRVWLFRGFRVSPIIYVLICEQDSRDLPAKVYIASVCGDPYGLRTSHNLAVFADKRLHNSRLMGKRVCRKPVSLTLNLT